MTKAVIEGCRISPQQRQVWSNSGGLTYWSQSVVRIEGPLRADVLKHALGSLVSRYENLRTTFHSPPEIAFPLQVVEDRGDFGWEEESWRGLSPAELGRKIEERLGGLRDGGAALDRPPVLHASLHPTSEGSHLLLLSCPSLCLDHRSHAHLTALLAAAYGERAGGAADDSPEAIQYGDYADWFNTLLEETKDSEEAAASVRFWKRLAVEEAAPPQLMRGAQAQAAPASRPDWRTYSFASDCAAAVRDAARELDVSAEALVFAAFQSFLARRSGSADFLVGYVSDGRSVEDLDGALGLLDHALPYRVGYDETVAFGRFARDTAGRLLDYRKAQDFFPLMDSGQRKPPPLSFVFQQADAAGGGGCLFEVERAFCVTGPGLLQLSCLLKTNRLEASLLYDAGVLSAEEVWRIAEEFLAHLESAASDTGAALGRLEIIGRRELHQVLVEWNETAAAVPEDRCIHELFAAQAAATPDATAVVCGDERLSYGELDRRANRLARRLLADRLRVEEPVGLYMSRRASLVVGVMGILKAGGVFVPLHPNDPRERVARILEDCGARFVITEEELADGLKEGGRSPLCLDDGGLPDRQFDGSDGDEAPTVAVGPHNLAYVLYTSGSTGVPKGVMVEHRSLVNLRHALHRAIYDRHDALKGRTWQVSMNAPLSFDSSLKQLALLLDGHTLHIVPEPFRLDSTAFVKFQERSRLDVLDCTPSQLKLFLATGLFDDPALSPRVVLVGGEAIGPALWDELARVEATAFYNVYGPTECTVDATAARVSAGSAPHIGRPISNVRVYLLNEELRPTPVGTTGELCIAGAGVARGYLGDDSLTAERFIDWAVPGDAAARRERLYRTGDLAHYASDGRLVFEGRADNQVKVRGYRVELGEVERILGAHPQVGEAVVLARESNGLQVLTAFIVRDKGAPGLDLSVPSLRKYLQERAPDYMLPAAFVFTDALPLTSNGKVDHESLLAMSASGAHARAPYAPPGSELEKAIVEIWQELLEVEKVGVEDNFFDLGGHSLLMVQVHNRLQELLGRDVAVMELFRYPTISSMARYLNQGAEAEQPSFQKVYDRAARQREAMERQNPRQGVKEG